MMPVKSEPQYDLEKDKFPCCQYLSLLSLKLIFDHQTDIFKCFVLEKKNLHALKQLDYVP